MEQCNGSGSSMSPSDPPTVVPDSGDRTSVGAAFGNDKPAPLAASVFDQSALHPPSMPTPSTENTLCPAASRPATALSPEPAAVVLAADAVKPDPGETGTTRPQVPVLDRCVDPPQPPLPVPARQGSALFPPSREPDVDHSQTSEQQRAVAAEVGSPYSSAWQSLAREVGSAAAAARPSLCACKKLAVAAMMDADASDGGAVRRRSGRVCANRAKEAGCQYRAFDDAPIVPSTTVSHDTLSLVLRVLKNPAPAAATRSGLGAAAATGHGGKETELRHHLGSCEDATGGNEINVVPIEVRRWLMDCVASVHCPDAPLRAAMVRLVPPELGQMHLSPDGSGPLIALHLAAVELFVESLSALPGVLEVEGSVKNEDMFSIQKVPAGMAACGPRPVCPRKARVRSPRSKPRTPRMAAPVPIRVSDMVATSIWDLDNMIESGLGTGGGERPEGALTDSSYSSLEASGWQGETAYAHKAAGVVHGEGTTPQNWSNKELGWPIAARMSREASLSGDGSQGRDGGGGGGGGMWTDSDGYRVNSSDADNFRQGNRASAHSILSSSGSSSSPYAGQHAAEAAASKRQTTDSSMGMSVAMAGAGRQFGHHLHGYSSIFSGVPSASVKSTDGGEASYTGSHTLGEGGAGGFGPGEVDGGGFGESSRCCGGGVDASADVGTAWVDAVFESEAASSASPFLLHDE